MKAIGILLGGGITSKGTVPHDIHTRIHKACELFSQRRIDEILITGGATNKEVSCTEAKVMAKLLKEKVGMHIILEEKAKDTIGNAIYSKEIIIKKKLPKNIIIITSDYHMPRALRIFQHIFGSEYIIIGAPSHPHFLHKLMMMFREWEEKEVETLLLTTIPKGDHKKAEKFMLETIEKYKNL